MYYLKQEETNDGWRRTVTISMKMNTSLAVVWRKRVKAW